LPGDLSGPRSLPRTRSMPALAPTGPLCCETRRRSWQRANKGFEEDIDRLPWRGSEAHAQLSKLETGSTKELGAACSSSIAAALSRHARAYLTTDSFRKYTGHAEMELRVRLHFAKRFIDKSFVLVLFIINIILFEYVCLSILS
jgi:hypothetical protein